MAELSLDIQTIFKRLEDLEREIRQLRDLLRSQLMPAETARQSEHPGIERALDILSSEPIIQGTRTPVRAIVEHWQSGQTIEEIARHLPYLRPAQIFDALSYYEDHREEIDRYITINQVPVE